MVQTLGDSEDDDKIALKGRALSHDELRLRLAGRAMCFVA